MSGEPTKVNPAKYFLPIFAFLVAGALSVPPDGKAQTTCSNSTTCGGTCTVPLAANKLPAKNASGRITYTVCTHQSVSNLNNQNLQTGINNMVSNWNATLSGNSNAPAFQTGSSGCNVTVQAGTVSNADAQWNFTTDSSNNITGGTVTVNSNSAGSWSADLATTDLVHELGH